MTPEDFLSNINLNNPQNGNEMFKEQSNAAFFGGKVWVWKHRKLKNKALQVSKAEEPAFNTEVGSCKFTANCLN